MPLLALNRLGRFELCDGLPIFSDHDHLTQFYAAKVLIEVISQFTHANCYSGHDCSLQADYIPVFPFINSSNMDSGTCTATTSPRTVMTPLARIHSSMTTLRPWSSFTLPRTSSSMPSGVGFR